MPGAPHSKNMGYGGPCRFWSVATCRRFGCKKAVRAHRTPKKLVSPLQHTRRWISFLLRGPPGIFGENPGGVDCGVPDAVFGENRIGVGFAPKGAPTEEELRGETVSLPL